MASVLRFQDLTPSLTPPPSDLGECEDSAMLHSDSYLPEVFYPSPAPSFSHQRPAFTPQSPDMGHSDSTYDTEEETQQNYFFHSSNTQLFANTAALQTSGLYAATMPYASYEQSGWVHYNDYPATVSMFQYPNEESPSVYPVYMSPAPSTIIPPVPQGVTSASFDFNGPISKSQDSSNFLRSFSNSSIRHHSLEEPSTNSISGMSSRSSSPGLSSSAPTGSELRRSRRASLVPHRSSSSSLHAYGIPIRSPESTSVQAWRCAFPNCTSRAVFTRGCDLRKHYNRHSKHLFCRIEGCPQSEAACVAVAQQQAIQAGADASDSSMLAVSGGFSSKKDRARHEAKHAPSIKCEVENCGRVFSRMDNMKDHCRRIHFKQALHQPSNGSRRKSIQQ